MAIPTELQTWLSSLKSEGGLTDEQFSAISSVADSNPKAAEFMKGSVLRQQDYSRNIQEAKKLEAELKAKEEEVNKFESSLHEWKVGAEKEYAAAVSERDRLKKALLGEEPEKKPEEPQKGATMTKEDLQKLGFISREEVTEYVGKSAQLDAAIHDLSTRHWELYGKPLPNAASLVQEAIERKVPLKALFEDRYKVKERETQLAEEAYQKKVNDEVEARMAKAISEGVISGAMTSHGRPGEDTAHPVLRTGGLKPPPVDNPVESGGLSAAVAAYQAGKYRNK